MAVAVAMAGAAVTAVVAVMVAVVTAVAMVGPVLPAGAVAGRVAAGVIRAGVVTRAEGLVPQAQRGVILAGRRVTRVRRATQARRVTQVRQPAQLQPATVTMQLRGTLLPLRLATTQQPPLQPPLPRLTSACAPP